jgi:hypothetical protein
MARRGRFRMIVHSCWSTDKVVPWYLFSMGLGSCALSSIVSRSLRHLFILALISVEAFESACRWLIDLLHSSTMRPLISAWRTRNCRSTNRSSVALMMLVKMYHNGQRARLTNVDTWFGDMSFQIQIAYVNIVVANAKRQPKRLAKVSV